MVWGTNVQQAWRQQLVTPYCHWDFLREEDLNVLPLPTPKKGKLYEVMDTLINLRGGIISQGKRISNHHVVHFRYQQFVNSTVIKLERKKKTIEAKNL